jgi:hypothetical protein
MRTPAAYAGLAGLVLAALVCQGCPAPSGDVVILVSPQTILLSMDQGGEVTVHAEIYYSLVDTSQFTLNGIPAQSTYVDNRGELVAKFPEAAVKAVIAPPLAILTLNGVTTGGEPFSGSDIVAVNP